MTDEYAVLAHAADLIEQRGLAHGHFRDETGALCMMGAIRVAIFGSAHVGISDQPGDPSLYERATDQLDAELHHQSIPVWNDAHTQAEVVAALRAAAGRRAL